MLQGRDVENAYSVVFLKPEEKVTWETKS